MSLKVIKVNELVKTESSNVGAVAFVDESKTAFVTFKNGTLYKYEDVDREDFELLRDAESVGRHLRKIFLSKGFEYEKLEDTKLELEKEDKDE